MKNLIIFSVVLVVAVAKPSGIAEPHLHSFAYSAPVHESYVHAIPSAVHHHDAAFLHHPFHETIVAETPVVHHKTIVSDVPTAVSHQHSSVVNHGYTHNTVVAEAPAFVHHKSIVQPVLHQSYVAEAPVVHHRAIVAEAPAYIHQKSIVADAPVAVSHQESTVVHKPAFKQIVEQVPAYQRTVVHEAPVVQSRFIAPAPVVQSRFIAPAPVVHQKAIIAEPIGVKQTISHQDSSIVHAAGGLVHHHVPVVADAPLFVNPTPISSQYHAQDGYGQYSFGYTSPLSSKAEIKTADGITKGAYNFFDAAGFPQEVSYVSDDLHGFRVAATNLPVGPAPVVDTPEVAEAKAAHFAAHESTKAAVHAVNVADSAKRVVHQEVVQQEVAAPVLPSAYSFSYLAQQPLRQIAPAPYVRDGPLVGVAPRFDAVPVAEPFLHKYTEYVHDRPLVGVAPRFDAVPVAEPFLQKYTEFVPGVALTRAGVPVDTPEVAQAKAAHFAAYRGVQAKDEKPCD